MFNDDNVRRYVKALYPVALLLVLVPLADLTLRTFPPQFGTLQWRFATVGLLIGNMGTVMLGLGLIGLVAAIAGQRLPLRILGYVGLVAGVVILAVLVLFVLDAVQMRRLANPNFKRAILMSSVGAMFTGLFGAAAVFSIGRGALLASRAPRLAVPKRGVKAAPSPIVAASAAPRVGETL